MITKFKLYESVCVPYKVGDYALIKLYSKGKSYKDILVNIIRIDVVLSNIIVKVLDNRIEKMFKKDNMTIVITNDYIKCWSESKEELEAIIAQNKYNL